MVMVMVMVMVTTAFLRRCACVAGGRLFPSCVVCRSGRVAGRCMTVRFRLFVPPRAQLCSPVLLSWCGESCIFDKDRVLKATPEVVAFLATFSCLLPKRNLASTHVVTSSDTFTVRARLPIPRHDAVHPLKAREIAELVSRLAEHADSQVVTKFVAQVGAAAAQGGDDFSRRKLADMFRKVRGDCIDMCTARVRFLWEG